MIQQYITWRHSLSVRNQLFVILLQNFVSWLFFSYLINKIAPSHRVKPFQFIMISAFLNAFVFTLMFRWTMVKEAFRRES